MLAKGRYACDNQFMTLLRKKPARVSNGVGCYYNSFPTVQLGSGLEVVVPSLVFGENDARKPKHNLFDIFTESDISVGIRILAKCIEEPACQSEQLHLVDTEERLATGFFVPEEGMDLNRGPFLPAILAHKFGIIGLGLGNVSDLFDEIASKPEVGIVRATQ